MGGDEGGPAAESDLDDMDRSAGRERAVVLRPQHQSGDARRKEHRWQYRGRSRARVTSDEGYLPIRHADPRLYRSLSGRLRVQGWKAHVLDGVAGDRGIA